MWTLINPVTADDCVLSRMSQNGAMTYILKQTPFITEKKALAMSPMFLFPSAFHDLCDRYPLSSFSWVTVPEKCQSIKPQIKFTSISFLFFNSSSSGFGYDCREMSCCCMFPTDIAPPPTLFFTCISVSHTSPYSS